MDDVTFTERPASRNEREIADLLREYVAAMNTKDVAALRKMLHDDAEIEMTSRGFFFPREEHLVEIQKVWGDVRRVKYQNIIIRVREGSGDSMAYVEVARQSNADMRWIPSQRYIRCKRADGKWLIYKSGYLV